STSMIALQRRLWSEIVVQRAQQLAAAGDVAQARQLLDDAENHIGDDAQLALIYIDARIDIDDRQTAKARLQALVQRDLTAEQRVSTTNLQVALVLRDINNLIE